MQHFTKSQRRRLRELSSVAYEREVNASLQPLAEKFNDWRNGKLSSLALSGAIHDYDYGDSRFLWGKYSSKYHDILVAGAIARGFLTEEEVGDELMKLLSNAVAFMKQDSDE